MTDSTDSTASPNIVTTASGPTPATYTIEQIKNWIDQRFTAPAVGKFDSYVAAHLILQYQNDVSMLETSWRTPGTVGAIVKAWAYAHAHEEGSALSVAAGGSDGPVKPEPYDDEDYGDGNG